MTATVCWMRGDGHAGSERARDGGSARGNSEALMRAEKLSLVSMLHEGVFTHALQLYQSKPPTRRAVRPSRPATAPDGSRIRAPLFCAVIMRS